MRVVDLGCGTGELTRELHEQLDAEETLGIDSSETMLLRQRSLGGGAAFEQGDIEAFVTDRPFDLVFSNAALHWVPDHEGLFARLTLLLRERPDRRADAGQRRPSIARIAADVASLRHRAAP